jgi:hypothetical protein
MCDETEDAAHYIAAKSASAADVPRVVREVIADRRYPLLGDKAVAALGLVISIKYGTKTPDELAAELKQVCLQKLKVNQSQ